MKKYIDQQEMREANTADVFGVIRKYGRLTRREVKSKTNMSWGAVSAITARLIEDGYIVEKKSAPEGIVGRIPSYLEVNDKVHFSIGIDVNNLGFRAVLLNLKRESVNFWEGETDVSSKDIFIPSLLSFLQKIISESNEIHIFSIGISMQGIVNSKTGISVTIPGRSDWQDLPLAELVYAEFGIPTFVEHDTACILYATSQSNSKKDTMLIRADDGIGMAAMIDGKIIDKPGIFELGHTVAVPDGLLCACGKRGCLGKYSSQRGLAQRYGKSFEELISDVKSRDENAISLLTEGIGHLAFSIINAAALLNVDNIVLCGSLWSCTEDFCDKFMDRVKALCGKALPSISFTEVTSAPIGAALIAEKAVLRRIDTSKE